MLFDLYHQAWCDAELHKNKNKRDVMSQQIEKLASEVAHIEKFDEKAEAKNRRNKKAAAQAKSERTEAEAKEADGEFSEIEVRNDVNGGERN